MQRKSAIRIGIAFLLMIVFLFFLFRGLSQPGQETKAEIQSTYQPPAKKP
jgi:hypothetical protein